MATPAIVCYTPPALLEKGIVIVQMPTNLTESDDAFNADIIARIQALEDKIANQPTTVKKGWFR